MTKANQVAPLLATLRRLIPDATEAIDEFAKLAKYVDEVEARAEKAERALAALRDQVAVAGCAASALGERTYNCRHDNLCGLCRLRHRAENAKRELAALHALIHDQSGLDDHKHTPGQMVAEMAARWQGASDDCDRFERERDEARAEVEELRRRVERLENLTGSGSGSGSG